MGNDQIHSSWRNELGGLLHGTENNLAIAAAAITHQGVSGGLWGSLAPSGDVVGCHNLGEAATSTARVEAREAAQEYVTPHFNSSAHKRTRLTCISSKWCWPSQAPTRIWATVLCGGDVNARAQCHSGPTWSPSPEVLYSNTLADETHIPTQGSRCPRDSSRRKSVLFRPESLVKPGDMGTRWGGDWVLCPLAVPRVKGQAGLTNAPIQLALCSLTIQTNWRYLMNPEVDWKAWLRVPETQTWALWWVILLQAWAWLSVLYKTPRTGLWPLSLGDPMEPLPCAGKSSLVPAAGIKSSSSKPRVSRWWWGQSPSPHISTEPRSPLLCQLSRASTKNISHWTNQFNLKKHASKNILRNVKATFKRKTSKTLENAWLRQASIIVLGWFDKNSSPPCLWMTVFTQKTFFFKNNYSNPPLKWGLHFNPPFHFLWFPNWHLPDFRE